MIREKVLEILTDICDTNEIRNNPDIEIFKEGLLDSFGTIEFFVALQDQLNMEVAPTEVDREMWATPNKIIAYLEERKA